MRGMNGPPSRFLPSRHSALDLARPKMTEGSKTSALSCMVGLPCRPRVTPFQVAETGICMHITAMSIVAINPCTNVYWSSHYFEFTRQESSTARLDVLLVFKDSSASVSWGGSVPADQNRHQKTSLDGCMCDIMVSTITNNVPDAGSE
ncbi:hypothetical protein PSPO01_07388 [Paraphaeosphaeria sporulosa]